MPTLVEDCPRCLAKKSTFDTHGANYIGNDGGSWISYYEVPSVCRNCNRTTIFLLRLNEYNARELYQEEKAWLSPIHLNTHFDIISYISLKDVSTVVAPEHVPKDVAIIFTEAAICHSMQCFNAAGAMFRLVLDLATKELLPADELDGAPNRKQRKQIFDRLAYLFETGILPRSLEELAACVREDGNDAAHDGTLAKADAEDLLDFSRLLLERIYTEPARLVAAKLRRDERRA